MTLAIDWEWLSIVLISADWRNFIEKKRIIVNPKSNKFYYSFKHLIEKPLFLSAIYFDTEKLA